jgi:hypothetical protein
MKKLYTEDFLKLNIVIRVRYPNKLSLIWYVYTVFISLYHQENLHNVLILSKIVCSFESK